MSTRTSEFLQQIRERMAERALSGAPQWLAPVNSAAANSASCLLIGALSGKLPSEDAVALVETIIAEQNPNGSWSPQPGGGGDLSLTLEVVEALTGSGEAAARTALMKAVGWLETHRHGGRLDDETFILLSALTDLVPGGLRRVMQPVSSFLLRQRARHRAQDHRGPTMPLALEILGRDKAHAVGRGRTLLELQLIDGSWEGSTRATVFALAALRHASVPVDDPAFDRGWRYLRSLQLWHDDLLQQIPCDFSNIMHATALRTLLVAGTDEDVAAGCTLSLLHGARMSGGWAVGGYLPTDLMTTALSLDALSFGGDSPVETLWQRRRAVLLLLRSQRPDGGWPLYAETPHPVRNRVAHYSGLFKSPSRVDVTATVLEALVYSGVREAGEEQAIDRGVSFLMRRQTRSGSWKGDVIHSDVFSTARSLEALIASSDARAGSNMINAIGALIRLQNEDGGWSDGTETNSRHACTAWALRALLGSPGVPSDVVTKARRFLEANLDDSELLWDSASPTWPLPFGGDRYSVSDLTTMWALEALALAGTPARARTLGNSRTRSIFDRSK